METERKARVTNRHTASYDYMDVLKQFTYGQYIATTLKDSEEMTTRQRDYIAAATINWASQVAFEPPMVMVAVNQQTDLHETIEKSRTFALHLVGEGQEDMVYAFSKDSDIDGNTVNGYSFVTQQGFVIIEDTLAHLKCEVKERLSVGDHAIFIGQVMDQQQHHDGSPLHTAKSDQQYA